MTTPGSPVPPSESSWLLDDEDLLTFASQGYLVLRRVVPEPLMAAAEVEIEGLIDERDPDEGDRGPGTNTWFPPVARLPLCDATLRQSPVLALAQQLVAPNVLDHAFDHIQVATTRTGWSHVPGGPHIDGHAPGQDPPHSFSMLAGILLTDQRGDQSGNLWVWPGSHLVHQRLFHERGSRVLLQCGGHATMLDPPVALDAPVPIEGSRGDVVLAHFLLGHNKGGNTAPIERRTIYFRLAVDGHPDRWEQTFLDPWTEYPRISRLLPDPAPESAVGTKTEDPPEVGDPQIEGAVKAPQRMHDDEIEITEELVRRLLHTQVPELADLPLTLVQPWGTDNAIWRLGDDLAVRLPRIHWATGQVDFEAAWLPRLAPHLPTPIPQPVAIGGPAHGYPYRWAIHRWLPGRPADADQIVDRPRFALDLAEFVRALWHIETPDAPPAAGRARPLADYDHETRRYIDNASHLIDTASALEVWETALAARPYVGRPVWVQGDLEGNCLVEQGRLSGVVDWGSACTGDPAVDVQVVWSPLFNDETRDTLLRTLNIDQDTIARSRGAAVHQACGALPYYLNTYPEIVARSRHKLAALGIDTRVPDS